MSTRIDECRATECPACGAVAVHPMSGVCAECGYDAPVSMEPQPFCAVCGVAPGGSPKRYRVGGLTLEYPEGIDAHHPFGRPGPVVYLCHDCHMRHHRRDPFLDITWDSAWTLDGKPLHVWNGID